MRKVVFFLAFMLVCMSMSAQTQETKEELKGEVSAPLSSLKLANDLIRYGYAQQNALSLIQALEIMAETPTQELGSKTEKSTTTSTSTKEEKVSFDFANILADAKEFADGDEHLLALISKVEAVKASSNRGAVGGPRRNVDVVHAHSTDTYQINFVSGYLAEVVVSGDGDTDLDLYVYDGNGNLIAKDADYSDDCYVSWVPRWTGRFIIKVVNRGPLFNRYAIITN